MKYIHTLIFLFLIGFSGISQTIKTTPIDTTQMCIPYSVAQKILVDLNDYDRLKEVVITYKNEIYELNNKVLYLKKENESWVEDNKLNREIIVEKNKAIEIYKTENEDLKKENKRLKTKNGLYNIISAAIIVPLTYLLIIK
jgi:cell shape-determining protein MreC